MPLIAQTQKHNTTPAQIVNAHFPHEKLFFANFMRHYRKITAPQPLIFQGKQTFFIFLAEFSGQRNRFRLLSGRDNKRYDERTNETKPICKLG